MWTTFALLKYYLQPKQTDFLKFFFFPFFKTPFVAMRAIKKKKKASYISHFVVLNETFKTFYETRGKKEKKRLSVGHVRGYSMHRYGFAFLLVYKSDKTEHFPLTVKHSRNKHSPLFDFYISGVKEWRKRRREGALGFLQPVLHPPTSGPPCPSKDSILKAVC